MERFHKRLDELRRDQTHGVAKRDQLLPQMMSTAAGFHPHPASGEVRKVRVSCLREHRRRRTISPRASSPTGDGDRIFVDVQTDEQLSRLGHG